MTNQSNPDQSPRALILTGENNHDWERSAPFVADLLDERGPFSVDLTEDPDTVLEDRELVEEYDLFFVDYNGPLWSERSRQHFEAAVEAGAGVSILHAADNAFEGWEAWERMCGLMWIDEAGHGAYHEFEVSIEDENHPVTAGMDDFELWDELYHDMPNPQDVDFDRLASAYSDPESGGTGQDEPVAITRAFGEGRIFHCILGHVWPGDDPEENPGESMRTFENDGFQTLLLRGCEWAATGEVYSDG